MKRILFVDDETKVLDGLQRMLHAQRNEWDMQFVPSGAEALALLETNPFDVVVSDVRMPEMDGSMLLQRVQQKFPSVIRVVLSGYFEREAALKAAGVAHQYLAKPCQPDKLRETIDRLFRSTAILTDEPARRVVGAIGSLPSLPGTCMALMEALQKPDMSLEEIGRIIEQDVSMSAKVLQLVNSPLFGLAGEPADIRTAVGYMGLDALRQLVLSAEILRTFQPEESVAEFSLEYFQRHCRLAARIASRLPAPKEVVSAGVMAALLHDIGKLVMAVRLPLQFERAWQTSLDQDRPVYTVEDELMGTSHAEIGAYLLSLWGLPTPIVDAVARHHHPTVAKGSGPGLDLLAITHISDALACELEAGMRGRTPGSCGRLNLEYVEALGVAGQLPAWRKKAGQLVG